MKCDVERLAITAGEIPDPELATHLEFCTVCSAMLADFEADRQMLVQSGLPELGSVRLPVMRRIRWRQRVAWSIPLGAAAMFVVIAGLWQIRTVEQLAVHPSIPAPAKGSLRVSTPQAPRVRRIRTAVAASSGRRAPSTDLVVKMATDDPDVVIYWLVDRKEQGQ